jgi:arylesterase / paraoxonase
MTRHWKLPLVTLVVLVVGAGAYAAYIYVLAGETKSIASHFAGSCRAVGGVVGAEDLLIDPDSRVAYISSDDRRATIAAQPVRGAIFGYDLSAPRPVPRNLTPDVDATFHPHGIGLWVTPHGRRLLFVVNHPRSSLFADDAGSGPAHTIDIFEHANDGPLVLKRRITSDLLISPNDVVPVDEDRFYVTNDHGSAPGLGRTLEEYLRLRRANVLYFDGQRFTLAAGDLRYANGIATSPDGGLVYVSEVTSFSVAVYRREPTSGALTQAGAIPLNTGPDNISIDSAGDLWIGAHPKLLTFTAHAKNAAQRSPSQVLRVRRGAAEVLEVSEVFSSRGDDLSGSSAAAWHAGRLLIGSVFDPHFLDCQTH